ncbi:MAG TPA: ABC transporter permease [Flavisolibacter sp.]|nr:ABC transporter permease [Flavisolibacter sp.]
MRRLLEIVASSFKMALQELWKNKLRTFLSLFGVTIGIFCIIGVLATVNSLQTNIQNQLKSLGNNTIYIDKWEWNGGGPDYPWWKYAKRPVPKFEEVAEIKKRTATAQYAAYFINTVVSVDVGDNTLSNVRLYGVTQDYQSIQGLAIQYGRFLTEAEFQQGTNSIVMGNEIAETIFGEAERAVGKQVSIKGRKSNVIGVIKKEGSQIVGGWQFDKCIILPYNYAKTLVDENRADPILMVKGSPGISSKVLKDELTGSMRSVRKLNPTQENNFSLNDINDISENLNQAFISINIGGWAIGALAFIVGIFGVANIMFVTVKERTSQIGLKKALGAKNKVILMEFLLESAFLCIFGGAIGLLLLFILTKVASALVDFPFFLSPFIIALAVLICIIAGILAGIIPASRAAKMDPVVAIRS